MRFIPILVLLIVFKANAQYQYPPAKTVDSSDVYFGKTFKDPYRWLENPKDVEAENWLKKQADFTNAIVNKIPGQETIIKELMEMNANNSAQYSFIVKAGSKYFYHKKNAGDFVAKIYYREGQSGTENLLFDPMEFSPEKPITVSSSVSSDGLSMLLKIVEDGKEVSDFRILDVASKKIHPDILPHSMFAEFVAGSSDKILYFQLKNYDIRDPENALNPKTLLHKIGTPVENDKTILSSVKYPKILDDNGWCSLKTYPESPYIFIEKSTSSNYRKMYFAKASDLEKDKIDWKIFSEFEDEVWKIIVDKKEVYSISSKNNPYFKVLKTTLPNHNFATAKEIFKGNQDWKLAVYGEIIETYKTADHLIINLSKNELQFKTLIYDLKSGKSEKLKVPLEGNITAIPISGSDNELRIVNYSWLLPNTQYLYNLNSKKFAEGPFHSKIKYPGMENLTFEELEISSYDGTLVPLSLIYDKTLMKKNGSNTALMTGYGAYGTTLSPNFNPGLLPFLKRGGIYAIAHVRGGGEKGNNWHLEGKKSTKPNSWKDFNACAEYLIKQKFTTPEKLGCTAGSAGGILIGRAITERPDLYKVAIPKVAVLNILRFVVGPNAQGNFDEFGTLTNEKEFNSLLEMDALHHIKKETKYPAQLITTGFNDPRVPSFLVAKFAATMQAANDPKIPTLLYVDYESGHFGGSSPEAYFKQVAMEYAFLFWQTGHPDFQE